MIRNSKQNWEVGQKVKVGFLTLVVRAALPTPGDWAPDAYLLTNVAGDKLYEFVPHNGCRRIEASEARELLDTAKAHAEKITAQAIRNAAQARDVDQLFSEVA